MPDSEAGDVMSMAHTERELSPEQARRQANATHFSFATTDELPPAPELIGQQLAQEAIDFALEIEDGAYNLYVSGMSGSGRLTTVLKAVERAASQRPAPPDWCYVHHFERPGEPLAISLPAGSGRAFARDVDAFVAVCRRELARLFSGEGYRAQRATVLREVQTRHRQLLEELEQEAASHGFILQPTPLGMSLIPVQTVERHGLIANLPVAHANHSLDMRPLTPEEFSVLPAPEQERIRAENAIVQEAIARTLPRLQELETEARERVQQLDGDLAQRVVEDCSRRFLARYMEHDHVSAYVRGMCADMVAHAQILGEQASGEAAVASDGNARDAQPLDVDAVDSSAAGISGEVDETMNFTPDLDMDDLRERIMVSSLLRRYKVNVLVAHEAGEHAPVVQEINPTPWNLVGHSEFGLRSGIPYTDHLMIRAGALHRANGGYLILQVRDLFRHPESWDAIKRVLRFRGIDIEGGEDLRVTLARASMRPEPIRASVKVILIGDPEIYSALTALDPEFGELFAVRADFEGDLPWTDETERFYAQFIGACARDAKGPPLTASAVVAIIEEGGRWVEDQDRLTARMRSVQDLVLEAGYFARKAEAPQTDRLHVTQAIAARERRLGLVPDKLNDLIQRGVIMIDTQGSVVGQVNGLTVMSVADYEFGLPARITARTSPGAAGILNLERETMMSGPAHSKGILILNGYLAGRYATDFPLSLTGSICFEQIYGEIEGDSASSAELYALLSSLSGAPIRQSLAVTGSVNQRGEVQAVGGVTAKIEGFFHVCQRRGLTGQEGVLIPRANVRNLMLREEVVEAMRAGQFHIYAVSAIDEGIELLTGVRAGEELADGEDTINARVWRRLRAFSEQVRSAREEPAALRALVKTTIPS